MWADDKNQLVCIIKKEYRQTILFIDFYTDVVGDELSNKNYGYLFLNNILKKISLKHEGLQKNLPYFKLIIDMKVRFLTFERL